MESLTPIFPSILIGILFKVDSMVLKIILHSMS